MLRGSPAASRCPRMSKNFREKLSSVRKQQPPAGCGHSASPSSLAMAICRVRPRPLRSPSCRPVEDPLQLRDRRRQQLRRERPHQAALQPRLALDGPERVAPLALGALPQHLAGEDEVGPLALHDLLGLLHHEDAAVDAGVGVGPVPVLRVKQHVEVGVSGDVDVLDLDLLLGGGAQRLVLRHRAVLPPALAPLRLGDAEAGVEVDGLHLDPLRPDHGQRQRGVESAGDHRDGLARLLHGLSPTMRWRGGRGRLRR